MSSSPPREHPAHHDRSGLRRLAPRSLLSRLILTTLLLVALVSVVVGGVTTLALRHFLLARLDDQLIAATHRHGGETDDLGGPELPCLGQTIGFGFGQAPGTLIGRFDSRCQSAVIINNRGSAQFTVLQAADTTLLARLPTSAQPRTVSLSVGDYRVVAEPGTVTGLPTSEVNDTLRNLVVSESGVALGGVVLAALIGTVLVRRQLAPLRRVAATATEVTHLPLESGEVGVTVRVPAELTDPSTEVGQVGAALNAMLGHVERALDTRHESEQRVRQFVADASHELRTPLSTIVGYAELTRRTSDDPETMAHAMSRIQAESGRMAELVNDLLLLARLDSGRSLERGDVDVTRLLAETVNDARVLGADHVWRLTLPADPLHVEGDCDRLQQVLANLLTNAIRHTPEHTIVSISAVGVPQEGVEPHGIRVTVHDNGPGMPTDLAGKEFERFSRGDSSRTRASGGAGLGLSIVQAIVAAHHGAVTIRSAPGDTTIEIRLPSHQPG